MKVDTMSRNIVRIMQKLAGNKGIQMLLLNDTQTPMASEPAALAVKEIMKHNSPNQRIVPTPFEEGAVDTDGSFIRVYYNQGDFNANETIAECDIFIDIVVSRNLWLIKGQNSVEPLIRPYEILDRVVDTIGRKSLGEVKLKIDGFQHHYVNTKYDAIRLYCSYMSIETMKQSER